MYDSRKMFRLMRPTKKFFSSTNGSRFAGAHVQDADVGAANRPGQLDADVERHLAAFEQSDLSG